MNDRVLHQDWHIIARLEDLSPGQLTPIQVFGIRLVVWRSQEGIRVWRDRCPHRGVPLSGGWVNEQDQVVCPYHGLAFNGNGQCVQIPASPQVTTFPHLAQVQPYSLREQYGYLWVALDHPTHDLPFLQEWHDPGFKTFHCGPYVIRGNPFRVIENFIDVAHLPFVHQGLLGDRTAPAIADYVVTLEADGITAHDIRFQQPDPDGTGLARSMSYTYRVLRPLLAYFQKGTGTEQFSIVLGVTPVSEGECIAWIGVARNYALDVPNEDMRRFQDQLMAQDIPMIESQQPQALPIYSAIEFHIPADKFSLAYRKWLNQLGITFGVC